VSEYDLEASVLWNPWSTRGCYAMGVGVETFTGVKFVILVIME